MFNEYLDIRVHLFGNEHVFNEYLNIREHLFGNEHLPGNVT